MGRGQDHVACGAAAETSLTFGPMRRSRMSLTQPPSHPTPVRAQHLSPTLMQLYPSILLCAGGIMTPLYRQRAWRG